MSLGSSRYLKEYRQNEISTSSQGKLILVMYDGAIKNAKMALKCLENKNISGRGIHIRKTHDIINELSLSLDQEKGQHVAKQLEDLYRFMMRQLILANVKGESKPIESVLLILNTLKEAWVKIIQNFNADESLEPKPIKTITAQC